MTCAGYLSGSEKTLRALKKEAYILALGRAFLFKEKVAGSTPAYEQRLS